MESAIWVIIGGASGTTLRYLVFRFIARHIKHVFPWPTITVNLSGSFIMGFLFGISNKIGLSPQYNQILLIGFLGSFTTFSTFSNETLLLIREKRLRLAILNIFIQNAGGIFLALLGRFLGSNL